MTTSVVKGTAGTRLKKSGAEDALLEAALELCRTPDVAGRYERMLESALRAFGAEAACLLRLDGDGALVPMAVLGVSDDVLGRRFVPAEHPRLAQMLESDEPVRFPDTCELPDPLDDFTLEGGAVSVHACMGCALKIEGVTVGLLALDSTRSGAFDHVPMARLVTFGALLAAAFRTSMLAAHLERTRKELSISHLLQEEVNARAGTEFIGISDAAARVREEVELLAQSDIRVLITGETGVGKEVVARSIHGQSARADRPILYVNCAALPEAIAESELFGHTKGAFTGANETRAGKFEAADGGTLFLDEVGELPLSIQPKLLRVLQTGELQRVGSDRTLAVNVRVLAATNRDLEKEVAEGRFRADLYHRLSVYPLVVPPLRERDSDVLVLASYFLDAARARLGVPPLHLTPEARNVLLAYDWPGNVRELEHLLERAALRASGLRRGGTRVVIGAEHLGIAGVDPAPQAAVRQVAERKRSHARVSLSEAVTRYKRALVKEALEEASGNLSQAARVLELDRGNLHRLAKRLGLLDKDGPSS